MSGSTNYNRMNATWNHPQVTPQLEQEYDLDPTMFDLSQDPTHRYTGRRQQTLPTSQDVSFSDYSQSFSGTNQQGFTFTAEPSQNLNQSFDNGNTLFDPSASSSTRPQSQTQQRTQQLIRGVYSAPSTSHPQPHTNTTTGVFHDPSRQYSYPPQQSALGIGQSPQQPVVDPNLSQNVHNFNPNPAHNNVYVSPPHPYGSGYSPSPGEEIQASGHLTAPTPSYFARQDIGDTTLSMFGAHPPKRLRGPEDVGQHHEGDGTDQDLENKNEIPVHRPPGACARCKGLKVRCEFKTDPDTCKRCLNGGYECVIPGRKKRRAPPKREHLLNQIRDQAAQIKTLMGQLDEANLKAKSVQSSTPNPPSPASSNTDLFSTVSFPSTASVTSPDTDGGSAYVSADQVAKPDVLDWIAKAHKSLEEFGDYISMGGPGATRGMLGEDDDELTDSSVDIDGQRWEFAVEDPDDVGSQTEFGGDDGGLTDQYPSGDEGSNPASADRFRRHQRRSSGNRKDQSPRRGGVDRLATIPSSAAPFGLMADISLGMSELRISGQGDSQEEDGIGLANSNFFRPTPVPERPLHDENIQALPHILSKGVVIPQEVEALFKIYFDYMNLSVSLLDPVLYTSQKTYMRSPFLFTVICAIASKYYSPKPELYKEAMHYARLAAGTALIGGRKSVEVVQAYILLALYPMPCSRWEDDRTWVYLGLAIRIASDLNLHHPPTAKPQNEQHAREMLNRTRAWLNCFNLDRSTGSQYGKPPVISNTDYTGNHSGEWWNSSPYNMKGFDIHIAGYNAELRVIAGFGLKIRSDPDNPTGFNKNLDIAKLAQETDDELSKLWDQWRARINQYNDPNDDQTRFRSTLLKLAYSYARLTALSFGFQYAFGKKTSGSGTGNDLVLLWRCWKAATDVVRTYIEDIGVPSQKIYLRHGPEAQSVFVTFASTFLIKLLQPRFSIHFTREHRLEMRSLVERIADLLGCEEVDIVDKHHYPRLYSRFLKGLLVTPLADVNRPSATEPQEGRSQQSSSGKAQSASPVIQRAELSPPSTSTRESSSTPSSARPSLSPPPNLQQHFDQYNAMATGIDAFSTQHALMSNDITGMNVSEFFQPPLPFDSELLQSMQTLTDPELWPDMITPGFAWMGGLHQTDTDMVTNM